VSKDLYYTIPQYFLERMHEHSNVLDVSDVSTDEFYLYRIHRRRQGDVVLVWLSDAYLFTDMDYHNRPRELGRGDYALVAKPEGGAHVSPELIAEARIGVGKLGEFMGALTKRDTWTYQPPNWQEQQSRRERFREWRKGLMR
jgi:hypothetical protein